MKKLFALVLAVAMVLSMASVAFAASYVYGMYVEEDDLYIIDDHTPYMIGDDYDDDNEVKAYFGDTLYMEMYYGKFDEDDGGMEARLSEIAKEFKISADWSKGGSYVEGVSFENVFVNGEVTVAIAIDTIEQPTLTKAKDVIGTITIDPKSKNFIDNGSGEAGEEYKFDVAFTLNVKEAGKDGHVALDETADDNYVYKFDEDEEYELELYAGMGRFVVNTYGQDKLVINTDVDYNEGIENVSPDANYVYFNSNNATFNRLGDLYLTADEDNIVYAVNNDGSLRKISPAYDEDEEAFVIRTRVIGSYVIAEEELPENALTANVEKEEAPVAPVAPANPSTGAAC